MQAEIDYAKNVEHQRLIATHSQSKREKKRRNGPVREKLHYLMRIDY